MPILRSRSLRKEIMDGEERSAEETVGAYRRIRLVNRYLGGTRVILKHLGRYAKNWPPGSVMRILDVAAGACDIPEAMARWARRKGLRVRICALDINTTALSFAARELAPYPEISLVRASIFEAPFRPQTFDYVISSMFFHHLSDAEAVNCLRLLSGLAARGVIVNDLLRHLGAYLWIRFLALFSRNAMFRHDAPLSVLRGYVKGEAREMIEKAGLSFLGFHRHCFHRFAIAGEK